MKKIIYLMLDFILYLKFKKTYGAFRGCYDTFDEAVKNIDPRRIGYDNYEIIDKYLKTYESTIKKISEPEYPMFFWLKNILDDYDNGLTVFDFGGNFGTHFYKFYKFARGKLIKWTICEVESICKVGREKFSNNILDFTTNFNDCSGYDIFFSSGAIQYVKSLSVSLSLSLE